MKSFFKVCLLIALLCSYFSLVMAKDLEDTITDIFSNAGTSNSVSPWRVTASDLLVGGGENSAESSTDVRLQENFFRSIQAYMIGLLGIVSVWVFLYLGYTLFTANGKEEDFKKAWKWLTYAVVGLAIIPLAYIAVKIVTGFTL